MAEKEPETYRTILEADKESQQRFSSHGSAIAQAYNHTILPLSNSRDKHTQILWGIRDFEFRFGRRPEGMWLPETAVDLEVLDILAGFDIRFTILSPYQAKRTRKLRRRAWRDASGGRIDPSMPYSVRLPSGKRIAVFFYDGPISQAIAFEGLLEKGENLAGRFQSAFSDARPWPQIVHIATDGETYGHHHKKGEMALAYALHHIETNNIAKLTIYGEYLERHPPTHEAEIWERTAWSCVHGVERWNCSHSDYSIVRHHERNSMPFVPRFRHPPTHEAEIWERTAWSCVHGVERWNSHCGCNSGRYPNWNQYWRTPLRQAFDWLRDTATARFEQKGREIFEDPWQARNEYINVILNRWPDNVGKFFKEQTTHELSPDEGIKALKLIEMQRHALLMCR